jgi:hypothetical protein
VGDKEEMLKICTSDEENFFSVANRSKECRESELYPKKISS